MPRVMNVDKNPAYPAALKRSKPKAPSPAASLYASASTSTT